jgi:hypothetical protein
MAAMIIPQKDPYREDKVMEVLAACEESMATRREIYARRRRFFMFGSDDQRETRYNRMFSHTDLVASFLYSADHATYNLSAPLNSPKIVIDQSLVLQDEWNQKFRDWGLAYQYGTALLWSLIYDSMFLKVGWNDEREVLGSRLIQPHFFGVYDESEPDLDAQEAFVHEYRLPYDNAVVRLYRAGLKNRVKDLGVSMGSPVDDLPPVLKQLLITQTGGQNLSGNLMGQAPLDINPAIRYEPQSTIPTIMFKELWIWNDVTEDYTTFTICDPDILLNDSRDTISALKDAKGGSKIEGASDSNIFMPQEHPFVPIIPYQLPDYFWGEAHSERLIPLQQWSSERLDQIAEILEQQVDPAKVFSGFMGLSDEKAGALGGPNSWVLDALPGAKVERLMPEMPPDIFAEFKEIGAIFLEASGLTETVVGKGEKNVRGGGHSKQLAMTGSGRIRKVAIGLEPSLIQLGDLGLKLFMRNSDEELTLPDEKTKFLPAQYAAPEFNLRIAGHSHSPLFVDESREMAQLLLKAQSIDREMFVRLINPPQRDNIITSLRARVKQENAMRALNPAGAQGGKGGKAREAHHGP